MVRQAGEFAEKDKARADLVHARNQAESLAYEAERVLSDAKEKLSAAETGDIEEKVKALRSAIAEKDVTLARVHEVTEALTKSLHAVAQKLYQGSGPTPGPGAPGPEGSSESPPGAGSGPVDADFKVVDDGKDGSTAS